MLYFLRNLDSGNILVNIYANYASKEVHLLYAISDL